MASVYMVRLIGFFTYLLLINCYVAVGQEHPLSNHDSALVVKYNAEYEKYLHHHSNIKDASHYINEIAFIYWEHNQYYQAIKYYKISAELNEQIENENGIAMINNNLGMLHADILDYQKSYEYFMLTLGARKSKGEKIGVISAMINLSVVLNNLDRYDESISFLQEALNLSREMKDISQMKSCYGMLSETYEKAGNAKQSIYYFNLYKTFTELSQAEINKIKKDYSEEKVLKAKLEEENNKNLKELSEKQQELARIKNRSLEYDEKLNEHDSINAALLKDLSQKDLQLQLLTTQSQIEQLKAEKEVQEERVAREKQRRKYQVAITISIGMVIIIFFILRNAYRTKKWAVNLKKKNKQIEEQGAELKNLNINLLQMVDDRTKTLRLANEKLSDFIFSNSHIIRRPVANIKGIINLIEKNGVEEKNAQLFDMLNKSNEELDDALNDFNESLTLSKSTVKDVEKITKIK